MNPGVAIEKLVESVDFDEDEAKAFLSLGNSPAYAIASTAMSRMLVMCGSQAIEDGQLDYWRGVKAGLNLIFELTETEAQSVMELTADLNFEEDHPEVDEDQEPDLSQAISALGTSAL